MPRRRSVEARRSTRGVEILAGVHWASLAWRPTKVDFGFGYVGSFRTLEPADVSARGEASPVEAPRLSLSGAYLAIGRTVVRQRHFRTWVELRGELLHARLGDRSFSSLGGAVRLSSEVFTAGGFAESRTNAVAVVAGALGLGVYVELSHRQLDDALGPTSVTTGISIRIPFVLIGAT